MHTEIGERRQEVTDFALVTSNINEAMRNFPFLPAQNKARAILTPDVYRLAGPGSFTLLTACRFTKFPKPSVY